MDLQRGLLTKLIDEDGLNKVKRSGIDIAFLDDSDCKQIFSYIERHYSEYKKVPSRLAVKQVFPNFSFVDYPEPLDFFVDQVKEGFRRGLFESVLLNVNRIYTENTTEAEVHIRNLLKGISVTQKSFKDLNVTESTQDRIEQYERRKAGEVPGILTKWSKIDYQTLGFHPEEFVVLVGEKYIGKALSIETHIPTPTGWTLMGDIKVGDYVLDEQGEPTKVLATTEVLHGQDCYKLTFSNKETIIADANHKWCVQDNHIHSAKSVVKTTRELEEAWQPCRFSIKAAKPLQLPEKDLPVKPYTLGVWLGDGTSRYGEITNVDKEVWEGIEQDDYELSTKRKPGITKTVLRLQSQLRDLGVLNAKHIPAIYLRGSFEQRLALLQGLMDSDGHCTTTGACEITQKSCLLIQHIESLLTTFGIYSYYYCCSINGENYYRLSFNPGNTFPIFRIQRKQDRLKNNPRSKRCSRVRICSIERTHTIPVRCIQVESKSSLYLAGRSMIPTHNSWLMLWMAYQAMLQGERVLFATKEMSAEDLVDRFDSILASVAYDSLRRGELSNVEERRYRDTLSELTSNGRNGSITMARHSVRTIDDIGTKAVEIDATIAFVDSVYLFDTSSTGSTTGGGNETSRRMAISQGCKRTAQELGIPIVVSTQAGRRKTQKPQPGLDNIEWSNAFSQDADVVLEVIRDDIDKELNQAWLYLLKARQGRETDTCVSMDFNYMKFEEINVSKEPSFEPLAPQEGTMWTE